MRFKISIEEQYQTHQDAFGEVFFDWRPILSTMASEAPDGWIIKFSDKVKPQMQAIGNSRCAIIGKIQEFEDGGNKFLKLIFSSVRGDYARTRSSNKPAGLPDAQDQRGEDPQGAKFL